MVDRQGVTGAGAAVARGPPFLGLTAALALLAASMTPSLLPRDWVLQGVVSGTLAAVGYGLGTLASHLWRLSIAYEPPRGAKAVAWAALGLAGTAGVAGMTVRGAAWQRELHALTGLPAPPAWHYLSGLALALAVTVTAVLLARTMRLGGRAVGRRLGRWLPPRLATAIGGLTVAALVVGLLDGVVIDGLFALADDTFRISDELVEDDAPQPASRLRSGGPGSLVAFEDLGVQGRRFVAGGPSRAALDEFAGPPVVEPIRVYAGLDAAEDEAERARLVVDELERTGGFDREVLAVMVATGMGRINPEAAAALEYLWAGDTALAAFQYSYLPSWMSFLVDAGRGREAGAALFDAVHDRWARLPEGQRPQLLVFGESLGADGAEAAFSGVADLRNRTDGALFVGPPSFARLWSSLVAGRDAGSTQRLPVHDGGATVRFAARPADLQRPDSRWSRPRVVYLQHASDPVVWWSPRLLLRRPAWLDDPRGGAVLTAMRWYPLVTFWQITADLVHAIEVPPGHGHNYGRLVADAWAAVAPPPGWTAGDTARLRGRLQTPGMRNARGQPPVADSGRRPGRP